MIVVLGSGTIDILAPLPHLPVPGETVLGDQYELRPGGKGANQAVAAVRAGGLVNFFGAIGDDAFGRDLLRSLEEEGLEPDGIAVAEQPTALAMVMIGPDGTNQIAVAAGANMAVRAEQVPDSMLTAETLLVLQMEIDCSQNWELIQRTKQFGGRVLLNLAPALQIAPEMLALIDILVVNEVEGATLGQALGIAQTDPVELCRSLQRVTGGAIVLTLGEAGSIAADADGVLRVAALPVDAVDTTGAGDAFVGALAAALDNGCAWDEALQRASIGGALACRAFGARTAMPGIEEITAAATRLPLPSPAG